MNMMCRTLCPQDVYICVDSGRYTHASAHTHLYMVFLFCFVNVKCYGRKAKHFCMVVQNQRTVFKRLFE